jgi:hypothetical protein
LTKLKDQKIKLKTILMIFESNLQKCLTLMEKIDSYSINSNIIQCRICLNGTCENVFYCGHLICNECVYRLKEKGDNMVKCPFCKQTCEYHKIFP